MRRASLVILGGMTLLWRGLAVSVVAVELVWVCSGCSGRGAPAEPRKLTALRTAADSHVTSLLMIKRWSPILHTRTLAGKGSCKLDWQVLPPQPGDPLGAQRLAGTLSDCTTVEALILLDGSGTQELHYPDGRWKTMTWSPVREDGPWRKMDLHERLEPAPVFIPMAKEGPWEGVELDYEFGWLSGSPKNEQRWAGAATLADSRDMQFVLERNDERDHLELRPHDGSRLEVRVPLEPQPWTLWWPIFEQGAEGSYQDPAGNRQTFRLRGSADTRWEEWSFAGEDGTVASFTIDEDFVGAGEVKMDGQLLGWLGWQSDGNGKLYPVGAGVLDAVPSAAARDFQVDQWIRNIAAMGPTPRY